MKTRTRRQPVRKPAAPLLPIIPAGQIIPPDPEEDFLPDDLEYAQFLSEYDLSQGGEVRVYREGPGGYRDLTFLDTFKLNEFDAPMLKNPPYNGGKFRIHVRSAQGMLKNFPFKCEPAPVAVAKPALQSDAVAPLVPMFAGILEGLKALSLQLATRPAGDAMNLEGTLKLMGALRGLEGGGARALDPFEMMTKFFALQKMLTGDRIPTNPDGDIDANAVIMQAMKTFAEPFAELMKRNLQDGRPALAAPAGIAAPGQPGAPASLPAAPGLSLAVDNSAPSGANVEEPEINIKFAVIKPMLMMMAQADMDESPYVATVLDTFTEDELNQYIRRDDWKEQLVKVIPEAAGVMPWFERLRAGVLAALTDADGSGSVGVGT